MKIFDFSLLSEGKRKTFFIFSGAFVLLLAASLIVGISDNPPGIGLAYASFIALFIAFAVNWNTIQQFVHLLIAALVGFVLFSMLHNAFYAGSVFFEAEFLKYIFNVLSALSMILAVLICPPAFVVGVIGSIVMFFRKRQE